MSDSLQPVVVVTGASAGVGRAIVRAFARRGDRLGLLARGGAGLDGARNDALSLGAPEVLAVPTDVADPGAVERAAQQVTDELEPPDVWINCAMASVFAPVTEIAAEEFRRVTEVTYLGYVYGTQAALRRMLPRDTGTIVQVGSALAYRGIPLQAPYCAAKHATQGFNDALRAELLHDGSRVRVTMVDLPAVNTPQFTWVRTRLPRHPQPVPPIFQPEVVAEGVLWAAEHAPRVLTIGASTVMTKLANRVVPGLLDRYLARTGYNSQQTDEPIDAEAWRDNLFTPVDDDKDHGAHGPFDREAKGRSQQLWAAMHKRQLFAGLALAGAASLLVKARG